MLKRSPKYLKLATEAFFRKMLWLPIFLITACHSPTSSSTTTMAESNIFIVKAEVVAVRQQDLSKVRGKTNMYTYLDLKILSSAGKADAEATIGVDSCHITRRALPGDSDIVQGKVLHLELGITEISQPQYCTWIKRLD